ncbi:hypothetical protein M405DRAFT_284876 [Rhizopogon salebrosus TDB-379]|nr:hypothetical protein M405DRAFT_284876 [Rhizopogon salebrosus TDB-379]
MAYLCKLLQECQRRGSITDERLTSSSRAGATSTVCAEILPVNKLKFHRRGLGGIGGDASTGRRKYRKSKKLRRRGGDGPLRGVSALQGLQKDIDVLT